MTSTISPRQQRIEQRAQQRIEQRAQTQQQRIEQRQQAVQQRQQGLQDRERAALTRQTEQRQSRIDRLQQRVQQLQAQKPGSARAQRAQQRLLQAQQRQLQREQQVQQRDLARQQRLGIAGQNAQQQGAAQARTQALAQAQQGRFAARFRSSSDPQAQAARAARWNGWAPRHAWRRGLRAAFVPWLGSVFWPYAYSDIFEYTFWPDAYDRGYWAYAYDDFVDTVFWGQDYAYNDYAYAEPYPGRSTTGVRPPRERPAVSERTVQQLCGDPDKGVTAWPIAQIERAVQPTAEQRALLEELRKAAAEAADAFKQSCGGSYAMTPPGRLQAMMTRVVATLDALRVVKPVLERFYESLTDEQKARFNALGPNQGDRPQQQQQAQNNNAQNTCGEAKPGLTNLPIEQIETTVRPTGNQKAALDRLGAATQKAVDVLQSACPDDVPLTPVGRLEMMEKRLNALLQAGKLIQPELETFYSSLTPEQKARFNALGQFANR